MIGRGDCDEVSVKAVRISGTEHYAEEAPELLKRYESISFADTHRAVMHLIPKEPCWVLDIGAGTGRDDSLPDLATLRARGEQFDVVMLTAVWMHLDERQRRRAIPNVAALVRRGGVMIMTLRHGPVPSGRRMFAVSAEETISLAEPLGLGCVLHRPAESSLRQPGVSWTRLAFRKSL